MYTRYNDVTMGAMSSQITSLIIVYSAVNSEADQRKHQSSASLAFVRGIHRSPMNSPHKGPVTRKMVPFDDVIIISSIRVYWGNLQHVAWHQGLRIDKVVGCLCVGFLKVDGDAKML